MRTCIELRFWFDSPEVDTLPVLKLGQQTLLRRCYEISVADLETLLSSPHSIFVPVFGWWEIFRGKSSYGEDEAETLAQVVACSVRQYSSSLQMISNLSRAKMSIKKMCLPKMQSQKSKSIQILRRKSRMTSKRRRVPQTRRKRNFMIQGRDFANGNVNIKPVN